MGCLFSKPPEGDKKVSKSVESAKQVVNPEPEKAVEEQKEQNPKNETPENKEETTKQVQDNVVAEVKVEKEQSKQQNKQSIGPVAVEKNQGKAFGLLLCGSGESGKTTFMRQLRLKYLNGFQQEEKEGFVSTIRGNLIETIKNLLVWLEHNSMSVDEENEEYTEIISSIEPFSCDFNEEVVESLQALWGDANIQEAFEHKDETDIPDHMQYFFEKLDDIADPDYIPTDEDVLRARIRTIGITNVTFDMDSALISIYDVGGQKNERSKWEKVMNEVGGVIFCVSFSEFDKPMFEDASVLRINDSIQIFEQLTGKSQFENAPFFLLFNKLDVFNEKIANTDCFQKIYPEFEGDIHNPEECAQYIIDKFLDVAKEKHKSSIKVYKIVCLNADDVVKTTTDICEFIKENYN